MAIATSLAKPTPTCRSSNLGGQDLGTFYLGSLSKRRALFLHAVANGPLVRCSFVRQLLPFVGGERWMDELFANHRGLPARQHRATPSWCPSRLHGHRNSMTKPRRDALAMGEPPLEHRRQIILPRVALLP
jgi:hypothetical protein